jgi:uncharacterized protein (TIGR02996 family)
MIRRFELDEGNTTRFWEIEARDAMSFTCRWGNVGAAGTSERNYAFGDAAAATRASEKLIAEKMKSGYAIVGMRTPSTIAVPEPMLDEAEEAEEAGEEEEEEEEQDEQDVPAPATPRPKKPASVEKWNPKLEALLADNPEDLGTWQVYADWLLEHAQPWGEVIALACGGKRPKEQQDAATKEMLADIDNSSIEWRHGTIEKVSLCPEEEPDEESSMAAVLARILAHPAGRFVRELELGLPPNDDIEWSFDSVLEVIDKAGVLPLLRVVDMTPEAEHMDQESWRRIGDIRCLWRNAPNLRELLMRGSAGSDDGTPIKMGDVVAPRLEKLVYISGGLDKRVPVALGKATLPELRHLELYFGQEDYGNTSTVKSLAGILAGKGLPRLEYLGLVNYDSEWEVALVEAVAASAIVKRLKILDLSKGTLFRKGAAALIEYAPVFRHLEKLDLRDNYLEAAQGRAIVQAIPCADVDDQREVDDWDGDEPYRYCSIGE